MDDVHSTLMTTHDHLSDRKKNMLANTTGADVPVVLVWVVDSFYGRRLVMAGGDLRQGVGMRWPC